MVDKRGTQSFFFRIGRLMVVLLTMLLIAAIIFGAAKSNGYVRYSPQMETQASDNPDLIGPVNLISKIVNRYYLPFPWFGDCKSNGEVKSCDVGSGADICSCNDLGTRCDWFHVSCNDCKNGAAGTGYCTRVS